VPDKLTGRALDEPTVVPVIVQQAARWPDRIAVVGEDCTLTYRELDQLTARLARVLRDRGAAANRPVAVLARRGTLQLAALLSVMRAGAAYVCIDTEQPSSRQLAQLADCGAEMILTDRECAGLADGTLVLNVLTEAGRLPDPAHDAEAKTQTGPHPAPQDLAYILYTSGSTGVPKGVAVTHGGLANYCRYLVEFLGCAQKAAAFASVTSLSTDLGNTAVFPALTSGGCVHLVPTQVARDPADFADYMQEHAIDHLKITPSHLAALLEYPDPGVLPREAVLLGGEALRWELADLVRQQSRCRIINLYGPTETTISCLAFEAGRAGPEHRAAATVPIGFPLAGTAIRVVDQQLQPVPQGSPGELVVSGAGLARGYWNAPDATAAGFRLLADGTRVYRTGDRVRQLADGAVEFLGRIDGQVKVHGHRVEPGEIEAALHRHPQVAQAAVVAVEDTYDDMSLSAYVVAAGSDRPTAQDLRGHLAQLLPAYMVPTAITFVGRLPFTLSGKIDRRALAPEQSLTSFRQRVST
jgi:amino acid adenylation domain-containing protein